MEILTSTELVAAGNRVARLLDAIGVPRRGSVPIVAGNRPELLAVHRGTQLSGRRFTPMSWRWSPAEVDYVVGNCEADAVFAEARFADLVADAAARVPPERRFAIGGSIPGFRDWAEVEALDGSELEAPIAGSHLMYTSGTTGSGRRSWCPRSSSDSCDSRSRCATATTSRRCASSRTAPRRWPRT